MRRSFRFAVIAISFAAAAATPSAHATPGAGPVIFSGPGTVYSTYTTPVAAVPVGGVLNYINADTAAHNVTSVVVLDSTGTCTSGCGPDTEPWCGPLDPTKPEGPGNERQFPLGQCPLLFSGYPVGIAGMQIVGGTENLVAGQVYDFTCTIHPYMFGKLIALPAS